MKLFLAAFILLIAGLAGCLKESDGNSGVTRKSAESTTAPTTNVVELSTTTMKIGNRNFTLELAHTNAQRERGLMYRSAMAADHGMIFSFTDEKPRDFWMHNTQIPLDIVYLNQAGTVVTIGHGKPYVESPTVPSELPMQYAIELNEGASKTVGLRIGDKLAIPAAAMQQVEP